MAVKEMLRLAPQISQSLLKLLSDNEPLPTSNGLLLSHFLLSLSLFPFFFSLFLSKCSFDTAGLLVGGAMTGVVAMQAFNVAVPEFALFRSEGRTLETYPDLLAHIEKLWDSPKVLEVLESCILRDPWEKNAKPFDLAAFKELVKLHGLASRSEPMPSAAEQQQPTGGKKDNTELPDSLGIDLEL